MSVERVPNATERPSSRQYLPWVDCAKGLGICLVVLAHLASGRWLHDFIYIFHMPLFFFLSGFLHRRDSRFHSYARKKAFHLLVPYASFVILTSLMKAPHFIQRGITPARVAHGLFVVTWGGEAMKGAYGVLWFLTCLFFTQQGVNWLLVRFRTSTVVGITAIGMLLSYLNYLVFPRYSLPLDANVVLAAAPFFLAGVLLQQANFARAWMTAVSLAGVVGASALLMRGLPIYYDMRGGEYGTPLVTPVLAVACIIGCLQLAHGVARISPLRYIFTRLGAVSMAIMFLHKELPGAPGYRYLERHGVWVSFAVTLLISYTLAELISRSRVTRAFFLGSSKDLDLLRARFFPQSRQQDLASELTT